MMESWLVAAGLTAAASMHCVGMCGGFVIAIAAPPGRSPAMIFLDQLLLHVGKATSYGFLGALAGNAGAAITSSSALAWGGRTLGLAAGLAILLGGLSLLGLGRLTHGGGWLSKLWAGVMGRLISSRQLGSSLVLGLVMGFLPCPLIYAGLGAAAATTSPLKGLAIMAGVALGTVPALAVVAAFGSVIPLAFRRHMARAAGVMLVVAGALTVARGLHSQPCHGDHMPAAGTTQQSHECCESLPNENRD